MPYPSDYFLAGHLPCPSSCRRFLLSKPGLNRSNSEIVNKTGNNGCNLLSCKNRWHQLRMCWCHDKELQINSTSKLLTAWAHGMIADEWRLFDDEPSLYRSEKWGGDLSSTETQTHRWAAGNIQQRRPALHGLWTVSTFLIWVVDTVTVWSAVIYFHWHWHVKSMIRTI